MNNDAVNVGFCYKKFKINNKPQKGRLCFQKIRPLRRVTQFLATDCADFHGGGPLSILANLY